LRQHDSSDSGRVAERDKGFFSLNPLPLGIAAQIEKAVPDNR
jgi:hypothetical protein